MQQINFSEGYPKEKLTPEQYIVLYRRIYREIRDELKDKIKQAKAVLGVDRLP